MSLEVTSIVENENATGYDQVTNETVVSNSSSGKSSYQLQEGRNDRHLSSVSKSSRTSANKASIAFNLSFSIKIANRTPFDPNNRC